MLNKEPKEQREDYLEKRLVEKRYQGNKTLQTQFIPNKQVTEDNPAFVIYSSFDNETLFIYSLYGGNVNEYKLTSKDFNVQILSFTQIFIQQFEGEQVLFILDSVNSNLIFFNLGDLAVKQTHFNS